MSISSGSTVDIERQAKVERIWKEFDVDGDGKLKREEAYNFLRSNLKEMSGREPTEQQLEKNFNIIDADKSGDLSKKEVYRYLKGFEMGAILKTKFSQ